MRKQTICAIFLSVTPAAAAVLNLGFDPPSQFAPVGASAVVQMQISGLGDHVAPSLGDFDIIVSFNPAILLSSSATFGDPLHGDQLDLFGLGSLKGSQLLGPGSFRLFEVSLDSAADLDSMQLANFTIATLSFAVIGPGTSTLSIALNSLGDSLGASLDATTSSAIVTTVPEPSSVWLLGVALALGIASLLHCRSAVGSRGPHKRLRGCLNMANWH